MNKNDSSDVTTKSTKEFLNYFGQDVWIHAWLAEKRTRLMQLVFPVFSRLGLVPDTISYIGIALLAGVAVYFVRAPVLAMIFLAGHVICDGLDGAYARVTRRASQTGAFTDLVCDQLGMLVVAVTAVVHDFVPPLTGMVYIALYLVVVVFGVIINLLGLRTRLTFTSKYGLYIVYAIWAIWGVSYFELLMRVFCFIMAAEVVVGYFRLKRGIRKKFDTEVRFTEGDPYSSKLNYASNVAIPITVLVAILIGANTVPIRAMLDSPDLKVVWQGENNIFREGKLGKILAVGVRDEKLIIMIQESLGKKVVREFSPESGQFGDYFVLPPYLNPVLTTLPVDGNLLLIADGSTNLLMGIDLESSLSRKRPVILSTIPLGHLRVKAMATTRWNGKKVWLVANYLYTRKTYIIDPKKALEEGLLLSGEMAGYINGGYPSGLAATNGFLVALNKSPTKDLLYLASLDRLVQGPDLLQAGATSFAPPACDSIGPVIHGSDILMLSVDGQLFRLSLKSVLKRAPGDNNG
ncbi:CDP-alcohol phosphatidyltransferase family protein [Thermodesulfobacteriota bacterium]